MTALYTTAEVAALLGISRQRVSQIAARLNLGTYHGIGKGILIFSEDDVRQMRERKRVRGPARRKP